MSYVTQLGDTWDGIAYKVYGNERLFPLLIDANPEHFDTVIFSAGVTLAVPSAPPNVSSSLPPWKRDDVS